MVKPGDGFGHEQHNHGLLALRMLNNSMLWLWAAVAMGCCGYGDTDGIANHPVMALWYVLPEIGNQQLSA
jgi:hypothetical protein